MKAISITIDNQCVEVPEGTSILKAAQQAGIYIPNLCSHPDLPSSHGLRPVDVVYRGEEAFYNQYPDKVFEGCRLCYWRKSVG